MAYRMSIMLFDASLSFTIRLEGDGIPNHFPHQNMIEGVRSGGSSRVQRKWLPLAQGVAKWQNESAQIYSKVSLFFAFQPSITSKSGLLLRTWSGF